tara:strand:+ start:423 stop:731 length:309 start_codon:yes stop_codon:yes gene_type:complete
MGKKRRIKNNPKFVNLKAVRFPEPIEEPSEEPNIGLKIEVAELPLPEKVEKVVEEEVEKEKETPEPKRPPKIAAKKTRTSRKPKPITTKNHSKKTTTKKKIS